MPPPAQPVASLRTIIAGLLDILTVMVPSAYSIAPFTVYLNEGGVEVSGLQAVAWFAVIAAYFIIGQCLGGTIWERILKTQPHGQTIMPAPDHRAAVWRVILAGVMDMLTIMVPSAYLIARPAGTVTGDGLELSGLHSLVWIAIVAAYFVIGKRMGGTIWDRLLVTQPNDTTTLSSPEHFVPQWRITLAGLLDLLTIMIPSAYVIARVTGNITQEKLLIAGRGAWLWLAVIIAYFVIGKRIGGTIWERVLKTHSIRR